jgi:tetratricopeptide (TPR) repeat protein
MAQYPASPLQAESALTSEIPVLGTASASADFHLLRDAAKAVWEAHWQSHRPSARSNNEAANLQLAVAKFAFLTLAFASSVLLRAVVGRFNRLALKSAETAPYISEATDAHIQSAYSTLKHYFPHHLRQSLISAPFTVDASLTMIARIIRQSWKHSVPQSKKQIADLVQNMLNHLLAETAQYEVENISSLCIDVVRSLAHVERFLQRCMRLPPQPEPSAMHASVDRILRIEESIGGLSREEIDDLIMNVYQANHDPALFRAIGSGTPIRDRVTSVITLLSEIPSVEEQIVTATRGRPADVLSWCNVTVKRLCQTLAAVPSDVLRQLQNRDLTESAVGGAFRLLFIAMRLFNLIERWSRGNDLLRPHRSELRTSVIDALQSIKPSTESRPWGRLYHFGIYLEFRSQIDFVSLDERDGYRAELELALALGESALRSQQLEQLPAISIPRVRAHRSYAFVLRSCAKFYKNLDPERTARATERAIEQLHLARRASRPGAWPPEQVLELVALFKLQGDFDSAITEIEHALAQDWPDPDGGSDLRRRRAGRRKLALELAALKMLKSNAARREDIGNCERLLIDATAALAMAGEALEQGTDLRHSQTKVRENAPLHIKLAQCYFYNRDYAAAERQLIFALEFAAHLSSRLFGLAATLLGRTLICQRTSSTDRSARMFTSLVTEQSDSHLPLGCYALLRKLYRMWGQEEDRAALEHRLATSVQDWPELRPLQPEALACVFDLNSRNDEIERWEERLAIGDAHAILSEVEPLCAAIRRLDRRDDPRLLHLLARAYVRVGNVDLARSLFIRSGSSDRRPATRALARMGVALTFMQSGEFANAANEYMGAYEQGNRFPRCLLKAAEAWGLASDFAAAAACFDKLIGLTDEGHLSSVVNETRLYDEARLVRARLFTQRYGNKLDRLNAAEEMNVAIAIRWLVDLTLGRDRRRSTDALSALCDLLPHPASLDGLAHIVAVTNDPDLLSRLGDGLFECLNIREGGPRINPDTICVAALRRIDASDLGAPLSRALVKLACRMLTRAYFVDPNTFQRLAELLSRRALVEDYGPGWRLLYEILVGERGAVLIEIAAKYADGARQCFEAIFLEPARAAILACRRPAFRIEIETFLQEMIPRSLLPAAYSETDVVDIADLVEAFVEARRSSKLDKRINWQVARRAQADSSGQVTFVTWVYTENWIYGLFDEDNGPFAELFRRCEQLNVGVTVNGTIITLRVATSPLSGTDREQFLRRTQLDVQAFISASQSEASCRYVWHDPANSLEFLSVANEGWTGITIDVELQPAPHRRLPSSALSGFVTILNGETDRYLRERSPNPRFYDQAFREFWKSIGKCDLTSQFVTEFLQSLLDWQVALTLRWLATAPAQTDSVIHPRGAVHELKNKFVAILAKENTISEEDVLGLRAGTFNLYSRISQVMRASIYGPVGKATDITAIAREVISQVTAQGADATVELVSLTGGYAWIDRRFLKSVFWAAIDNAIRRLPYDQSRRTVSVLIARVGRGDDDQFELGNEHVGGEDDPNFGEVGKMSWIRIRVVNPYDPDREVVGTGIGQEYMRKVVRNFCHGRIRFRSTAAPDTYAAEIELPSLP